MLTGINFYGDSSTLVYTLTAFGGFLISYPRELSFLTVLAGVYLGDSASYSMVILSS